MTQEDKQLLIKDICARLPYGVKVLADLDKTFDGGFIGIINKIEPYVGDKFPELKGEYLLYEKGCLTPLVVDEVKPYLRPMPSMTEEEENEYRAINCYEGLFPRNEDALDYVLSHHLDFRGLIPMGLALEAPEDMYKAVLNLPTGLMTLPRK